MIDSTSTLKRSPGLLRLVLKMQEEDKNRLAVSREVPRMVCLALGTCKGLSYSVQVAQGFTIRGVSGVHVFFCLFVFL